MEKMFTESYRSFGKERCRHSHKERDNEGKVEGEMCRKKWKVRRKIRSKRKRIRENWKKRFKKEKDEKSRMEMKTGMCLFIKFQYYS